MTDREINEGLLAAIGFDSLRGIGGHVYDIKINGDKFSPATSVDDLRKWVLPEIVRRKLWLKWFLAVVSSPTEIVRKSVEDIAIIYAPELRNASDMSEALSCLMATAALFLCDPAVLAAAALEVLEEDNDARV